jgi:LmbE family N-acetylglucosaminyl deacetylase
MKLAPLALALTLTASAFSQATFTDPANLRGERVRPRDGRELPIDMGEAQGGHGLQQLLRKLNTRASILNIVAHPDDEDGGMLTFYSRGLGARVADLSLTRGEGGQNAMTGDFEDALGLLRTQELLANDRYVGVDQMFGTEVDFGFSKTKEEAFAKWTHDRVLYDAVRAIRLFRPLVITATFVGGVTDGHGQHQVSGQIAQEAFVAAADPKVFPEMIAEGILPWQALKIYARVPMQSISSQGLFDYATGQYTPAKFTNYVTGEVTTTQPSVDVVVHEGKPDPLLDGKSYVQFARIGLGMQKSQIGPGVRNAPAGTFDVSYHRYGSRVANQPAHEDSFFDGIDTTLEGITSSEPQIPIALRKHLDQFFESVRVATSSYDPAHPDSIAPKLAEALKEVEQALSGPLASEGRKQQMPDLQHELAVKSVQLQQALALALGITVEATSSTDEVKAGTPAQVHVRLSSTKGDSPDSFVLVTTPQGNIERAFPCTAEGADKHIVTPEPFSTHLERDCHVPESNTQVIMRPYFTRANIEQPVYQLLDPQLRNAPSSPPALVLLAEFYYRGARFQINTVVRNGSQPINIVPASNVWFRAHAQVVPLNHPSFTVGLTALGSAKPPSGLTLLSPTAPLTQTGTFNDRGFTFNGTLPAGSARSFEIKAVAPGATNPLEGYRSVGYSDLPRTNYLTPATIRIVPVDLKLPTRNKIAYLPGTGDDVSSALASIGLTPIILTIADLSATNLAKYDTVILGVRTYNAHPDLHGAPTQALLDYARNGGTVVVQYQTAEFTAADAPYPLALGSNEKVVDETDPVQLLDAASPLLTTPNRTTPADFNSWIEERGHGFLSTWDAHYTALTETHDPGQAPQRGGLITTSLGKGRWTYCAFALYRQLPEAVPGAYRLFLNLLHP